MDITTAHVYSDNRTQEEQDEAKVSIIGENTDVKCTGSAYLTKKDPFAYNDDNIVFKGGTAIDFFNGNDWMRFVNREDFDFTPAANLDSGDTLEYGKDYYIYLCFDGNTPQLVVSKNATYPSGYTALTSRKIGFFHYGAVRKVSDDGKWIPVDSNGIKFGATGTVWQQNVTKGVIPNSIGDLKNKPAVFMPGMAKVGRIWMCIYQMSQAEPITFMATTNGLHVQTGALKSSYGAIPVTGTEGCNQYNFVELAGIQGMRLPHYSEWLHGAFGTPQGQDGSNSYGWTKTTNTARTYTGCSVDTGTGEYSIAGEKPYAVSANNLVDCAGNVWEWQEDYTMRQDTTLSWTWYNVLGANMGQAYLPNSLGLSALLCGGNWAHGVHCGPRCVLLTDYPWYVHPSIGARFACDSAA